MSVCELGRQHSGLWPVLYRLQEPQIHEYVQPRNPLQQQILPQQIMRGSMMFWYVNIWTSLINQTNNILTSSNALKHWPQRSALFGREEKISIQDVCLSCTLFVFCGLSTFSQSKETRSKSLLHTALAIECKSSNFQRRRNLEPCCLSLVVQSSPPVTAYQHSGVDYFIHWTFSAHRESFRSHRLDGQLSFHPISWRILSFRTFIKESSVCPSIRQSTDCQYIDRQEALLSPSTKIQQYQRYRNFSHPFRPKRPTTD